MITLRIVFIPSTQDLRGRKGDREVSRSFVVGKDDDPISSVPSAEGPSNSSGVVADGLPRKATILS